MNVQKSRILFALAVVGFLVLCNLGYLYAYSQGRTQNFAIQIDQLPIQLLSLFIFAGIIVFGVLRPTNEEEAE